MRALVSALNALMTVPETVPVTVVEPAVGGGAVVLPPPDPPPLHAPRNNERAVSNGTINNENDLWNIVFTDHQ
jgi:hypothetical protein